ncbi:MAG: acetyltransferase [Nitrosomonas sp.]|nr:acetyltransferase [Nitrosomonas sp.]
MFWQQARVWRSSILTQVFPIRYVFSHGRRHPLRPPKPIGLVYQRYISWLGRTLIFRTVDLTTDLSRFHRWMNDPVVAEFWQESGDLTKHHAYLAAIEADPHVINLIGCLDDEPFGYFEVYWAKEDRIAPYYDVDDFDRGWHVLIGEPHMRGKRFVTAWLPSISHYLFLDDDRTQRIVIEPRADNFKMIRNLAQCGYAHLKEFDFPHKRAMLGMLSRERFFSEQLWVPRSITSSHSVFLS